MILGFTIVTLQNMELLTNNRIRVHLIFVRKESVDIMTFGYLFPLLSGKFLHYYLYVILLFNLHSNTQVCKWKLNAKTWPYVEHNGERGLVWEDLYIFSKKKPRRKNEIYSMT